MVRKTYSDSFWGGDLTSCAGYEALVKRNLESKKMCHELEEYLKKRSKVEAEYSKSLLNLAKCFKHREEVGILEAALNKFRSELETISQCHYGAATFFQQQSDTVRKFKEDQTVRRKALEDSLNKAQNSKLSQLAKTEQLEKNYVRKFLERDVAEQCVKDISTQRVTPKEVEKAKNKAVRAEEDAEKADSAYKSAVKVLESSRVYWEKEMTFTCQSIQEYDEERITFLRQQLWVAANMDSKLSLETDNSCESVREVLEKCDVAADVQAFIHEAQTGSDHPEPFVFRHYTKIISTDSRDSTVSESSFNPYCTVEDVNMNRNEASSDVKSDSGLPKLLKKKSTS